MIKKRAQSKKKKNISSNSKVEKLGFINNYEKLIGKLNNGLKSTKSSINGSFQLNKGAKIVTANNSTKIIKQNKENFYKSAFQSRKDSTTITFDECEQTQPKIKQKNDFWFIFQIGSGGFGRVWKVQQKKTGTVYAMKQISKAKVIQKKSVNSIMNQKHLLDQLQDTFIINSSYSFQDRDNLYLAIQYLRGGDLRYHMCFYQFFDEEQIKFITSCIILALQYIHSKKIIHRDLKPENVVFQQNGYLRITDFGVARKAKQDNSEQTSGTPGYMAPQVICRMNHSFQSDFFALGVIIYELIMGTRPYLGDSRKQIRQKILAHQAKIHQKQFPPGWNPTCIDFINRLLKRNKEQRLGYNGIQQIKNHPWLKTINWQKLSKKQLTPPFIPGIICQSRQYQRQMQNTINSEINEQAVILLRTKQVQNLFKNYDNNKIKYKNKIQLDNAIMSKYIRKIL